MRVQSLQTNCNLQANQKAITDLGIGKLLKVRVKGSLDGLVSDKPLEFLRDCKDEWVLWSPVKLILHVHIFFYN